MGWNGTAAQFLVCLAAVAAPFCYWNGGMLELEACQFIVQYLANRELLPKIFDPYLNDLGTYQARELSYFIDYLDARVFHAFLVMDRLILVPLSSVAASLITIAIFLRGTRSYSFPALSAALLLLVYLTNYVHLVTMGMFYRSAKPVLAPLVVGTTFLMLSALRDLSPSATRSHTRRAVLCFATLSAMSLLDRQGFFYALVGFAVLLFRQLLFKVPAHETLAAGAAVAAMLCYNIVIAPFVVSRVNGYVPSLEFQRVPLETLFDPSLLAHGTRVLLRALSLLYGGVPGWVGLLVLMATAAYVLFHRRASGAGGEIRAAFWTRGKVVVLCLGIAASQLAMFVAMAFRHPPLYEHPDHAMWYYPLPIQALVTTLTAPVLAPLLTGPSKVRMALINLVLVAIVVSNVSQWRYFERQQRNARWFSGVYTQSALLKVSFRDGRPSGLRPGYREFYDFCLRTSVPLRERAERAGALVGDNLKP